MSKMFEFITGTANPLGGECPYKCVYCWARQLINRNKLEKYQGDPFLDRRVMKKRYGIGDFIFAVDMRDPCSPDVPTEMLLEIFSWMEESPDARFLMTTKNPDRYDKLKDSLPKNLVIGATIETDKISFTETIPYKYTKYNHISEAPIPILRLGTMIPMQNYIKNPIFISIEPILDFDEDALQFIHWLYSIQPWAVAVGYDNYNHQLPEPPRWKTMKLIEELAKFTKVYRKSLRRAWWEIEP